MLEAGPPPPLYTTARDDGGGALGQDRKETVGKSLDGGNADGKLSKSNTTSEDSFLFLAFPAQRQKIVFLKKEKLKRVK